MIAFALLCSATVILAAIAVYQPDQDVRSRPNVGWVLLSATLYIAALAIGTAWLLVISLLEGVTLREEDLIECGKGNEDLRESQQLRVKIMFGS